MDPKFTGKHYANKTKEQMRDVLMDPEAPAPDIFYHMIRGTEDEKNVTVIEAGTIGGEYIKTYGHYHVGNLSETYWVKFGQGVALLQKLDLNGEVSEFKAIIIKEGDKVFMPSGWGHVLVNTGQSYLVTVDDTIVIFDKSQNIKVDGHADYEMVKKMQGFAYYVVEKNGKPCLKKNPKYKNINIVETDSLDII